MTKVLVTGGGGFIGSHLCDRLVQDGHEVIVLDDFSSGRRDHLAGSVSKITLVEDSIANVFRHASRLAGVTHVFHLAALISGFDSLREPEPYVQTNVVGLLRLLGTLKDHARPRVIFASSSTVYGSIGEGQRRETDGPVPMSVYAQTKLTGEQLLAMYRPLYEFDDVSLRFFNVYGPRQSPTHPYANVTCKFAHAAATRGPVDLYGDGKQTRDFVYVDDVVEAMTRVMSPTPRRVYNVGTGREAAIADLLEEVQRVAGCKLEVRHHGPWPNDIRSIRASTEWLREDTGFDARVSLREGLERTVSYFRSLGAGR